MLGHREWKSYNNTKNQHNIIDAWQWQMCDVSEKVEANEWNVKLAFS